MKDHNETFADHLSVLDGSRMRLVEWLKRYSRILECPEPNGAYYALPRMKSDEHPGSSMDLVRDILNRTGVLLVPGDPFGAGDPPHFRISYGNLTTDDLGSALDRLSMYFDGA
jgi:aspartate/methionine/tyrosine aminotransferase